MNPINIKEIFLNCKEQGYLQIDDLINAYFIINMDSLENQDAYGDKE